MISLKHRNSIDLPTIPFFFFFISRAIHNEYTPRWLKLIYDSINTWNTFMLAQLFHIFRFIFRRCFFLSYRHGIMTNGLLFFSSISLPIIYDGIQHFSTLFLASIQQFIRPSMVLYYFNKKDFAFQFYSQHFFALSNWCKFYSKSFIIVSYLRRKTNKILQFSIIYFNTWNTKTRQEKNRNNRSLKQRITQMKWNFFKYGSRKVCAND